MSDRQDIRSSVTMEDVLDMLGLAPPNGQGKISCPFHAENTPSCHIYSDGFTCFGCGASGDQVWFVASVCGTSIPKAILFLQGAADSDVERHVVQPQVRELQDFTTQVRQATSTRSGDRSLAEGLIETRWPYLDLPFIETFGVRVSPNGLLIPHVHDNKVVGVKTVSFGGKKAAWPGSQFKHPYMHNRGRFSKSVVLCEGEPDTWAMIRYGEVSPNQQDFDVVGMPSGVGNYTDELHAWLCKYKTVFLVLDNDGPGMQATREITSRIAKTFGVDPVLHVVSLTPDLDGFGKDVCDALHAGWKPNFS